MKVLITSGYRDSEPVSTFRAYASRDRFGVHSVTEDPAAADIILFVENSQLDDDPFFHQLRRHPLVRQFREKCFMYNEHDRPYCALPGVYLSMPAPYFDYTRQRACGAIFTRNPYIEHIADGGRTPDLLYAFLGGKNAPVRDRVFALQDPEAYIKDTSGFDAYAEKLNFNDPARRYADVLARSRFFLCPRGVGTGTGRLQEVMQSARVPVILNDDWVAPQGPDWESFSLRLPEADAHRVPQVIRENDARWPDLAREARRNWEEWFAPEVVFHRMTESCADIFRTRRVPEAVAQRFPRPLPLYLKNRTRAALRPVKLFFEEKLRSSGSRASSTP